MAEPLEATGADSDKDEDEVVVRLSTGGSFDGGQVEVLLGKMGGTAPLDAFLRDFAKSKGFQRLGRNVRKSLETELDMLSRKGKILIKGGVIQLL